MAFTQDTPIVNYIAGGAVRKLVVVGATNATPVEISTGSVRHNLPVGTSIKVSVQGALVNTGANVLNNAIVVTSPTSFTLTGSVGNGTYTANSANVYILAGTAFNTGGKENSKLYGTVEALGGDGSDTTFTAEWIDGTNALTNVPEMVILSRMDCTTSANEAAATIIGRAGTITSTGFTVTLSAAPASGKDIKFAFTAI